MSNAILVDIAENTTTAQAQGVITLRQTPVIGNLVPGRVFTPNGARFGGLTRSTRSPRPCRCAANFSQRTPRLR